MEDRFVGTAKTGAAPPLLLCLSRHHVCVIILYTGDTVGSTVAGLTILLACSCYSSIHRSSDRNRSIQYCMTNRDFIQKPRISLLYILSPGPPNVTEQYPILSYQLLREDKVRKYGNGLYFTCALQDVCTVKENQQTIQN